MNYSSRARRGTALLIGACGVAALAGCGALTPGAATVPPPALASTAPAPVSTTASLAGTCTMGWEWMEYSASAASSASFTPGPPSTGTGTGDAVMAYQVTLTNNSASTADVGGFAVVFYDAGTEDGSDQEPASSFLVPGQSLTWTIAEDETVHGFGDGVNGPSDIPEGAGSCQFLQWSNGSS
jgi:hypothetical protein